MATARILVVDDDPLIRQLMGNLLEITDFEVRGAVDGADGLAQVAAFHPDVILLDLMLPDLDGYTVCRTLKADPATRAIPVIFLTASLGLARTRQAAAGAVACLPKPFELNALLAVVEEALEEAAHRGLRGPGARTTDRDGTHAPDHLSELPTLATTRGRPRSSIWSGLL
jgi:CheY-like chemotaxis protein